MSLETKYIWFDGRLLPFEDAKVHVLNHSLHYGSAVFEGIRCYEAPTGPAIFRLSDHFKRFFHSAATMGMELPFSEKDLIAAVKELIKENGLREAYIRPIAFYGEKMGLSPEGAPLHMVIAAWPWGQYLGGRPVNVKISSFCRVHPASSVMTAKLSGHYANSILASREAKKSGFDEALFLDYEGFIAEGPGENIFFVKDKSIFTPAEGAILPGLTRESVMKIAERAGYEVRAEKIKQEDLGNFSEAFFTGTAVEVNAIGKIGEVVFGNGQEGPVTKIIREKYGDIVRGRDQEYSDWLDVVV